MALKDERRKEVHPREQTMNGKNNDHSSLSSNFHQEEGPSSKAIITAQHEIMSEDDKTESVPPISRCSSGSSLSSVLSNLSVSFIVPRLNDSFSNPWNALNPFSKSSKRISQNLLLFQLKVVCGVFLVSMGLFMAAVLNFAAILFFFFSATFIMLLVYTILRYIRLLQKDDPLFVWNYCLPNNIKKYVTDTSIHEYMIQRKRQIEPKDPSFYKHMLIYFIPGLSQNDLHRLINELPVEHRKLLLQPGGIAKLLLPETLLNFLAPSQHCPPVHDNEPTPQEAVDNLIDTAVTLFPQAGKTVHDQERHSSPQTSVTGTQLGSGYDEQNDPPVKSITLNLPPIDCKSIPKKSEEVVLVSNEVNDNKNSNSLIANAVNIMISNYSYNAALNMSRWANKMTQKYVPYVVLGSFSLSGMASAGALGWSYQTGFSSMNDIRSIHENTQTVAIGVGLLTTALYGTSSAIFAFVTRYLSTQSYLYLLHHPNRTSQKQIQNQNRTHGCNSIQ